MQIFATSSASPFIINSRTLPQRLKLSFNLDDENTIHTSLWVFEEFSALNQSLNAEKATQLRGFD